MQCLKSLVSVPLWAGTHVFRQAGAQALECPHKNCPVLVSNIKCNSTGLSGNWFTSAIPPPSSTLPAQACKKNLTDWNSCFDAAQRLWLHIVSYVFLLPCYVFNRWLLIHFEFSLKQTNNTCFLWGKQSLSD